MASPYTTRRGVRAPRTNDAAEAAPEPVAKRTRAKAGQQDSRECVRGVFAEEGRRPQQPASRKRQRGQQHAGDQGPQGGSSGRGSTDGGRCSIGGAGSPCLRSPRDAASRSGTPACSPGGPTLLPHEPASSSRPQQQQQQQQQQALRSNLLSDLAVAASVLAAVADDAATALTVPAAAGGAAGGAPASAGKRARRQARRRKHRQRKGQGRPAALSAAAAAAARRLIGRASDALGQYARASRRYLTAVLQAGVPEEDLAEYARLPPSAGLARDAAICLAFHLSCFSRSVSLKEHGLGPLCAALDGLLDAHVQPPQEQQALHVGGPEGPPPPALPLLAHPLPLIVPPQVLLCGHDSLLRAHAVLSGAVGEDEELLLQGACLVLAWKLEGVVDEAPPPELVWLLALGADPLTCSESVSRALFHAELAVLEALDWRLPLPLPPAASEVGG